MGSVYQSCYRDDHWIQCDDHRSADKNHYNDMEIAQKREALENVLIPYKLMENRELLLNTGFRYVDTFFKWYNFSGMIAVK